MLSPASPDQRLVNQLLVEHAEAARAAEAAAVAQRTAREIINQLVELKLATGEYKQGA